MVPGRPAAPPAYVAGDAPAGRERRRSSPRQLVLPIFVADGLDEPRAKSDPCRGCYSTRWIRCARRRSRRSPPEFGGLMLFGVPHPGGQGRDRGSSRASDPDGILNGGRRARRGGRRRCSRDRLCSTSSPTTATAACPRAGAASTTTPPWSSRRMPSRRLMPGPNSRPQRHDGRPGRGDPRGPGRGRAPVRASSPTPPSTPVRSTARSVRRSTPPCRATAAATRWIPRHPGRECAGNCSTSPRARTS